MGLCSDDGFLGGWEPSTLANSWHPLKIKWKQKTELNQAAMQSFLWFLPVAYVVESSNIEASESISPGCRQRRLSAASSPLFRTRAANWISNPSGTSVRCWCWMRYRRRRRRRRRLQLQHKSFPNNNNDYSGGKRKKNRVLRSERYLFSRGRSIQVNWNNIFSPDGRTRNAMSFGE